MRRASSSVAENLDRMLADSSCWCVVAVAHGEAQAVMTVSSMLYIEWGRLGEIRDLSGLPERRRRGLARQLVARQGLVPGPGLLGGLGHHRAGGRATRTAQPILRSARLCADRSHLGGGNARGLTSQNGSRVTAGWVRRRSLKLKVEPPRALSRARRQRHSSSVTSGRYRPTPPSFPKGACWQCPRPRASF